MSEAAARARALVRASFDRCVTMPGGAIWPGARIVITVDGRFVAGRGCVLANNATVHAERATIRIGRNAFIGIGSVIVCLHEIVIGDDALIAEYVTIRDQDHAIGGDRPVRSSGFETAPVRIGNNVWIGAKATITRGVTIGDNAVIGANSVVTRDIPANSVAAGAPARIIRSLAGPRAEAGQESVSSRQ